jgi:hypothetical protein
MSRHWPTPASDDEAVQRLVNAFTGGERVTQINTSMSRLEQYLRLAVAEGRSIEREAQRLAAELVKRRSDRWRRWRRRVLVAAAVLVPTVLVLMIENAMRLRTDGALAALTLCVGIALAITKSMNRESAKFEERLAAKRKRSEIGHA